MQQSLTLHNRDETRCHLLMHYPLGKKRHLFIHVLSPFGEAASFLSFASIITVVPFSILSLVYMSPKLHRHAYDICK